MRQNILLLFPLALACNPVVTGVQGGVLAPYAQFDPKPERVYASMECKDNQGEVVRAPEGVEYELRRHPARPGTPPVLLEHMLNEPQARMIQNTWTESDGHHFFVWMPDVRGFEYVIPHELSKKAERRVYSKPVVRKFKGTSGAAVRPLNVPDQICQLQKL